MLTGNTTFPRKNIGETKYKKCLKSASKKKNSSAKQTVFLFEFVGFKESAVVRSL